MKKEFITPIIETELLTPQDRVMKTFVSEENTSSTEKTMRTYEDGTRPEENSHWYGF